MSYANMDHAGWVECQIASYKAMEARTRRRVPRVAPPKGWLAAPDTLSRFQRRAIDVLGIVGGGIYNAPINWEGVEWWRHGIMVPWRRELSTYDHNALTQLVLLCHEARIRCDVQPHTFSSLRISLFPRIHTGGIMRRHPNIEEAVATFRGYVGADHPTFYRMPSAEAPDDRWADDGGAQHELPGATASEPHLIRRHGTFFLPGAAGYTRHLAAAGIYPRHVAEKYLDVEGLTIHPVSEFHVRIAAEIIHRTAQLAGLRALQEVLS